MANKRYDQYPEKINLVDGDIHLIADSEDLTGGGVPKLKKVQDVNVKKTVVKYTDIVDNLTTEDAQKPLSANQGKILDDKIPANPLGQADVIDNLNSTESSKPLSANMGRALQEQIDGIPGVGTELYSSYFSLDGKEDTEATEFDNQMGVFQKFNYGPNMTSISSGKVRRDEVVLVPANSPEITYNGTWADDPNSSYKFGLSKISSTNGDSFTFDFSGSSIHIGLYTTSIRTAFKVELSNDGGSTYSNEKIRTANTTSPEFNVIFNLYSSLDYDDYRVRVTLVDTATSLVISFLGYETKMIQRPITQYYDNGASGTNAVAPLTCDFHGNGWITNEAANEAWNYSRSYSSVQNDYVEYKFYGSKVWVCLRVEQASTNGTLEVRIDGSTASPVLNAQIDTQLGGAGTGVLIPVWFRLDDGTLSEGEHTVRLTVDQSGGAARTFNGFAHYSTLNTNTLCNDTIMGSNSYAVGVDDSGFTFSSNTGNPSTGWFGNTSQSTNFLRRLNYTDLDGEYLEYTIPSNTKAIYAIVQQDNNGGSFESTLDSLLPRRIDTYKSIGHNANINLLYDSEIDNSGVDFNGEVLRITKIGGVRFHIEGLIFEIWDATTGAFDLDGWTCTQKWTRFNNSTQYKCPVSNTWQIDMEGVKAENREWVYHDPHTGWLEVGGTTGVVLQRYFRLGIESNTPRMRIIRADRPSVGGNNFQYSDTSEDVSGLYGTNQQDLGLMLTNIRFSNSGGRLWVKLIADARP